MKWEQRSQTHIVSGDYWICRTMHGDYGVYTAWHKTLGDRQATRLSGEAFVPGDDVSKLHALQNVKQACLNHRRGHNHD